MWAQGLTIGVLIAAGALTHKNRQEAAATGMRRVSAMGVVFGHGLTVASSLPLITHGELL